MVPELTEVSSEFGKGLQTVDLLNLCWNNIHSLPPGAFYLMINLKYLILRQMGISEILPETFEGLNMLSVLDLECNKPKNLPIGSFRTLTSLKKAQPCWEQSD